MSWGDAARTDYAANDAGRTGRGDYLVEQDTIVAQRPFAIASFTEASTSTAAWADAGDVNLRTPDFAVAGWFLHGHVYVKVAAGSGGQVRLTNVTDSNDGTAQTGISNTAYAFSDDLSVQVDAGPHTAVNIKVQIWGDGTNLMYAKNSDLTVLYALFWWAPS